MNIVAVSESNMVLGTTTDAQGLGLHDLKTGRVLYTPDEAKATRIGCQVSMG